jgi:simple sugar transport system ATP-binding protein
MALEVRGLSKSFGPKRALDQVDAAFNYGEVHAVLGENGAGKSTLMNVLAGFLEPDGGEVRREGAVVRFEGPAQAKANGIEMVHQHFMLVPRFSVEENMALAQRRSLWHRLDSGETSTRTKELAATLGWGFDPKAATRSLPVGAQQRLEILKALSQEAKVLILDEPTAVLSAEEAQDLFRVLRTIKKQGRCVILIAHKLAEVMSVADRVTVLREGKKVAEAGVDETDERQLATWMVGGEPVREEKEVHAAGEELVTAAGLMVKGDRGETAVAELDLEVRRGEVLGIGGVEGNGQIELAEALLGIRRPEAGQLEWKASPVRKSYVPQDRQREGLALPMDVRENLLVEGAQKPELTSGPMLGFQRIMRWAARLVEGFGIKTSSPRERVSALSGGNQQKIVLARALDRKPDLLVAVNPTRGLDLAATAFVHEQLKRASREGAAIVLFTTDHDELEVLSDRVRYMGGGRLYGDRREALTGGGVSSPA